jgi:hypothetical protein
MILNIHAVTADWSGGLTIEEHIVNDYPTTTPNTLSEFQAYGLYLSPSIVVNDAATVFFELAIDSSTTGISSRGAYAHDNVLYSYPYFSNPISLNQFYLELYTKAGILTLGRRFRSWGSGIFYNTDGGQPRDGLSLDMRIGSFTIVPFLYRLAQGPGLSRKASSLEYGFSFLYKNEPSDIQLGLSYSKIVTGSNNAIYDPTDAGGLNSELSTFIPNYSVFDLYLEKNIGNFNFKIEAPIVSGTLGEIYAGSDAKLNASAAVMDASYSFSNGISLDLKAGYVTGDSNSTSEFTAMTLNPGYKIANILFNYNSHVFSDADLSNESATPFFISITNAAFFRFAVNYNHKKWGLSPALIYAIPIDKDSTYNFLTNQKNPTPLNTTNSSYGIEVDLNTSYRLSTNSSIYSNIGVLLASKYFQNITNINSGDLPWSLALGFDFSF